MKKNYILLQMYDALRSGVGLNINDCCNRYAISVATFRRYIAFLRSYFFENYGREIIYDAQNLLYCLK